MMTATCPSYAGYRFPPEIIGHAVRLCFRFPLSDTLGRAEGKSKAEIIRCPRHYVASEIFGCPCRTADAAPLAQMAA